MTAILPKQPEMERKFSNASFLQATNNYISLAGCAVNNFLKTLDDIEKDFENFIRQTDTIDGISLTYMEENY
ncbi:MAG TPA: hypothetical protein VIQ00_04235 [Chitinophagaceae bacterium]|jgi:hypothetical protein